MRSVEQKLSKMAKFWLSKSIFYVINYPNISKKIFIDQYHFIAHFSLLPFFETSNFEALILFSKNVPNFCRLRSSSMYVVCRIKKILALNLLIFIYLHCIRRLFWSDKTLDTRVHSNLLYKQLSIHKCAFIDSVSLWSHIGVHNYEITFKN